MATDEYVSIKFVIPAGKDETTVSEALAQAFDACREAEMGPGWVEEQQILNTKTDVFVLDPFSGPAFDQLTSPSKPRCTVLGPRCLLSCLRNNTPVPELPYPLYTVAMRGLDICFSGLDPVEKNRLKELVEQMSGVYSKSFHDGVTHLVAGSVVSEKYNVAVAKAIPVMTTDWVHEVWRSSSAITSVTATEARFSIHRCPSLLGVSVSVSMMGKEDKDIVRKTVTSHGGQYSPSLEKDQTTVLVTSSAAGDKFQAAKKWNIPCVTSDWMFESIEAGHCLPFVAFRVEIKAADVETPLTKQDATITGLADISMYSNILNIDDTLCTRAAEETIKTRLESEKVAVVQGKRTTDWIAELELDTVKKAGSFLDGCKIYLSGFSESENLQLARLLKFTGAVRLTQLGDNVTHVLHAVAESVAEETVKLLDSLKLEPHNVSMKWVVESMKSGRPVPESDYPFPATISSCDTRIEDDGITALQSPSQKLEDSVNFEAKLLAQYGREKKSPS